MVCIGRDQPGLAMQHRDKVAFMQNFLLSFEILIQG